MKSSSHQSRSTSLLKALASLGLTLVALAVLAGPRPARASGLCYVSSAAVGGNTGSTWADAYTNLQTALHDPLCVEFWVRAGVYKPSTSDRTVSFNILPGMALYGGFAGNETMRSQRNPVGNVTILSGDIDNNDPNTDGNNIDEQSYQAWLNNSYHVVMMSGGGLLGSPIGPSTVLDGFTVTGGKADSSATDVGGGLYCGGGCSPTLANLTFSGNYATAYGGGLYDGGSGLWGGASPTLTNAIFRGNYANDSGGAMYNAGDTLGSSNPTLTDVTFWGNSAANWGGAMVNDANTCGSSSPVLRNVTFFGNAAGAGGAMLNEANDDSGCAPSTHISQPDLVNVTFTANVAGWGGAMENLGPTYPTLTNVILWGDLLSGPSGSDPEIYDAYGGTPYIGMSVVQGGCESITGADCTTGGNLSTDPKLGPLTYTGGYTPTVPLLPGSSAIDTGSNYWCPTLDQRGRPHADGDHNGSVICDIGAFEAPLFADVPVAGKVWMEPWVDAFYFAGVTTGCGANPLLYCPENSVTRAEMAIFLLRAVHGAGYTPPPASHYFADMPVAGKEWMEAWVDEFYREGLTSGCGAAPLIYCPENHVTRAEMAVFILRATHAPGFTPYVTSGVFADMPVAGKEWMESWVDEFYNEGITTGCGTAPLIYCPENNVTRAEMAVFIDRAFGLYP